MQVRFFASLRDQIGGHHSLEDQGPYPCTVLELWQRLCPDTAHKGLKVAVNQQYADWEHCIIQGDEEVAFFPPVTGG